MNETLEQIRIRMSRWIRDYAPESAECPCEESILLRGGQFHGYRFSKGDVSVIWIVGESTIEVRSPFRSDTILLNESAATNQAA